MAYNDMKQQDQVQHQPSYPQAQQTYQQGSYTGNTPGYSSPNPQAPQYAQTPYQQGAPYAGAPPSQGTQYSQGYQQQPAQAAPTQPIIVTQPQVVVGQPVMMMASQQCAPGQHVFNTHFGACGIIAAILLFPIGLIFLFVDQQRRCSRCGIAG